MSAELAIVTDDPLSLRLATICQSLAEAKSIDGVKLVRDQAQTIAALLKQQGYCFDAQNHAAEIKLRAERRLGELLAETVRHEGGRPKNGSLGTPFLIPDGISKKQSAEWQRIAKIEPPVFEAHIEAVRGSRKELTTDGTLRLAKQLKKPGKQPSPSQETGCTTDDLHRLVEAGKKYGCIYADPPWQYDNQATRASTDNHYATMTVSEIAKLPIDAIAAPTAHLHLWTTKGFLPDALDIIRQWGFTYKGWFVWCKHQMGLGNYWRSATELMLLAVRGDDATFRDKGLMDWGAFKRGKHSAKPAEIRGFIERGSSGPYLELFGRRKVKGWTVWGNEIKGEEFRQEAFV